MIPPIHSQQHKCCSICQPLDAHAWLSASMTHTCDPQPLPHTYDSMPVSHTHMTPMPLSHTTKASTAQGRNRRHTYRYYIILTVKAPHHIGTFFGMEPKMSIILYCDVVPVKAPHHIGTTLHHYYTHMWPSASTTHIWLNACVTHPYDSNASISHNSNLSYIWLYVSVTHTHDSTPVSQACVIQALSH